jgi:hypothetical protein
MTLPMLLDEPLAVSPQEERRRRRRRRLLLLLLVALSALPSVTTSVITISEFRERAITETDAWAPTAIDLRVDPALLMQVNGMLPGDRHVGQLTVANDGADRLRYALISSSTNPDGRSLRTALEAEVRTPGTGCSSFDGDVLYRGPLVGAGFGDPAAGAHAGDRLLEPGRRELLCVEVSLPEAAGNHYQRTRTTATFTVVAEHAGARP